MVVHGDNRFAAGIGPIPISHVSSVSKCVKARQKWCHVLGVLLSTLFSGESFDPPGKLSWSSVASSTLSFHQEERKQVVLQQQVRKTLTWLRESKFETLNDNLLKTSCYWSIGDWLFVAKAGAHYLSVYMTETRKRLLRHSVQALSHHHVEGPRVNVFCPQK